MYAIVINFGDGKPDARQYVQHDEGAHTIDQRESFGLRVEPELAQLHGKEENASDHVNAITQFLLNPHQRYVKSAVWDGHKHDRTEFDPLLREIEERFENAEKGTTPYKGLVFQIVKLVEDVVKATVLK
jgi:hypothetical protein